MALKPEWFVALLGAYVVYRLFAGVLNRMARGAPQPVRCAIALLVLPGAAGKVLGAAMGSWEVYVDLLLVGGIALLFAVDRRTQDQPPPARWRLFARTGAIAALVIGGLAASSAHAQTRVEPMGVRTCIAIGVFTRTAADFRDAGAERGPHLAIVRKRNGDAAPALLAILLRETERVYQRANVAADELEADAFERCMLGLITTPIANPAR